MILYEYRCKCGNKFDAFGRIHDKTHVCARCGAEAKRMISPVRCKLDPTSGHFPTATQKFDNMHIKEAQKTTS